MNFAKYLTKKIFLLAVTFSIALFLGYVFFFLLLNKTQTVSILEGFFLFLNNLSKGFGQLYNTTIADAFSSPLTLFWNYYQWSFLFVSTTLVISVLVGLTIGLVMGYKNNKSSDLILSFFVFGAIAIPTFVLAPILIVVAQNNDLPVMFLKPSVLGLNWTIASLIFPIILLLVVPVSIISTITKNTIIKSYTESYIVQMQANGMSTTAIFRKAIFKNICTNLAGNAFGILILVSSFSFIIERIFQIPGQSLLLINMIESNEINVLLCFLFFKLLIFLLFLLLFDTLSDVWNNLIEEKTQGWYIWKHIKQRSWLNKERKNAETRK
ncbi:ABC transporter permease subunit [Mycoplasmopsis columbinasalis]|uniref:Oligopeptide ABC transporter permease n=1 Tax=Mycoplasmopsis columbinasalis TaxID=114880 RepID=A0A449B9T4_9BACT|nr:ABC transporter permease subunit [Mycoplasmopsis columbinasalis]VEU77938.1 oligopeptide ABC transporter permease [Mycoplasmopsis columbinasalis]